MPFPVITLFHLLIPSLPKISSNQIGGMHARRTESSPTSSTPLAPHAHAMPPRSEELEAVAPPCSVQEPKQQAPMAAPQPAANTSGLHICIITTLNPLIIAGEMRG